MTQPLAVPATPRSAGAMYVLGGVILVAVALWFAFQAADGTGLETRRGSAVVVGKSYRPAGTTYTTTIINKQTRTVPHATPEVYVLDLDLDGARTQGATDRALYEAVSAGDRVNVAYRKRRLTSGLEVVSVSR